MRFCSLLTSCYPVTGIWRSVLFISILILWLSWVCTSQFHRFVWSPLEWGYIAQTLQWIEALKLFDNSNWSLSHATQFSWSWGVGVGVGVEWFSSQFFCKGRKNTKIYWNRVWGWGSMLSIIKRFLPFVGVFWNTSCGKKQGMSFYSHMYAEWGHEI